MRLSQDELANITGRKRKSSQVKWFKDFLNIDIPADIKGPILTASAYEDLVKKRLGVLPETSNSMSGREHPKVRLVGKQS